MHLQPPKHEIQYGLKIDVKYIHEKQYATMLCNNLSFLMFIVKFCQELCLVCDILFDSLNLCVSLHLRIISTECCHDCSVVNGLGSII